MFNRLSFLVLSLFCFSIFTAVTLNAQDVSKVSPKNYKVVIDNDKVQVLDNISNPGAFKARAGNAPAAMARGFVAACDTSNCPAMLSPQPPTLVTVAGSGST